MLDAGVFNSYFWQDGSTDQNIAVVNYGWYTVEVNVEGCSGIDSIFVADLVNVDLISQQELAVRLYPNPNKGLFTIAVDNAQGETSMEMFDLTGKSIYTETVKGDKLNETIDISKYPKGVYYVRVTTGEFTKVEKVIVQ